MMRFSTLVKHPADWMTGGKGQHGAVITSATLRDSLGVPQAANDEDFAEVKTVGRPRWTRGF
mgnify:CR=1 FL=1